MCIYLYIRLWVYVCVDGCVQVSLYGCVPACVCLCVWVHSDENGHGVGQALGPACCAIIRVWNGAWYILDIQ